MNLSLTYKRCLNLAGVFLLLHACGVDPLDSLKGPPKEGEAGYTICEDSALVDTDGDGANDECEKILGTDPNVSDTDGNGVDDGYGVPPNPTGIDCTSPTLDEASQQWCNEANGLGNGLLNDVADSSLLANSGLNASAPNGTQVEVEEQTIRIVLNHPSEGSGIETDTGIMSVCKNKDGTALGTFLFYHIKGDVMYCPGSTSSGAESTCEPKSPTTAASMDLCGPIDLAAADGAVDMTNFKWTRGYASNTNPYGELVMRYFDPQLLQKNTNEIMDSVELKLTPSVEELDVFTKLDVKFKSVFKISGKVYGNEIVNIETPDAIEVLRKFKRTGVINGDTHLQTPGITGLWHASDE